MGYKSKYKGSEIDSLLDKAKNDYTVKQYTDYAGYNADTSRPSNTISFVEQDNSIWVQGKQYSMNAGCYVGSDKAGTPTSAWYLAGTLNAAIVGWDVQYLGYCTNSLLSEGGGLFVLNLRINSATDIQIKKFAWLAKTGSTPNLRLVVSQGKVLLYVLVAGGQYRGANIRILTESTSAKRAATAGAKNFFGLSDNITPETTEPVGTDIADVPYLSKTGTAVQSNKVWHDFTDTANQDMRVLFGRANNNKDYDSIFKSSKLLFNPSTETLTVPTIKNPNGSWVHIAYKTRGTVGYVKVATITINQTHADEPICFEIMQRQQPLAKLRLQYATTGNTNPPLNTFSYQGTSVNRYYIHQTGSGVWDLYVGKLDSWTAITVSKVYIGGYSNGYYQNPHFTITWQDELVAAVPEGSVAATKATEYVNISGNAATASTATKLATARKIGFANFDGTADVSLNLMQGAFNVRWTTNTTQWQRIIRFKTKTIYTRKQLILAVYDTEGSSFSGIIEVTLIVGAQLTTTYTFVNWLSLWAAPNYNYKGMFKITATYPTDNDEYVYLDVYANSPYTYKTINFCVLSCNDTNELTIGKSGEWVEGSALHNVVYQSTTDTSLVPKQSLFATDSAFLQSLEGLSHKSIDGSLDLRRRTEYICGQQVLSDTEEAGKAFYGSSANPLVISVPLKDPDVVAGGKVNVNIIRFYYADTYWQELFFCVNLPYIYTRWVANGTARPWYRILKEDSSVEYNAWVQKATAADSAAVANKTKYPIVFKRNGASITNWFANTTFVIDIPEELLDYSAPTGITLKVPDEAKKVANDLEIRVNGKQKATFDGSSAKTVNIEASRSHFVKASMYGESWTSPPAGATTPGVPLILDTSYMIPFGTLQDGDTIIMQVPNTLTSTSGYPVYLRLDTTQGNVAGNLVKIIKGQNAGNPVEWKGTTALTAGYYHFVYSEGAGGLIYMYRNISTS